MALTEINVQERARKKSALEKLSMGMDIAETAAKLGQLSGSFWKTPPADAPIKTKAMYRLGKSWEEEVPR